MDATIARDHPAMRNVRAAMLSSAAVRFTFAGRNQDALRAVARAVPAVERAGGGVSGYTSVICHCCEALWRLSRADFAHVLERNLLAKTLAGDFLEPGVDARLAMAQLCALTGRTGEAHDWFGRARAVLDEQGARPLRALVDLDEAWMEVRRGPQGDRDRAQALLDVACEQFQAIGMPGWIERAEALRGEMGIFEEQKSATTAGDRVDAFAQQARSDTDTDTRRPTPDFLFRHEGDFWTLAYGGTVCRVKDAKGLHYVAFLLRHPGREFHVLDLIGLGLEAGGRAPAQETQRAVANDQRSGAPAQGLPVLDAMAKGAYRQRL